MDSLKIRIEELSKERDQFLGVILKNAPYNLGLEMSSGARESIFSEPFEDTKEEILIPYKPIGKQTWKERSFQRTKNLIPPPPLETKEDVTSN